jgi:dienelactone hydrolase
MWIPLRAINPAVSDSLHAETITIAGHGDDQIEAYISSSDHDAKRGGVVVIHHMPGYDRSTKEIVRRFAELGYDAICPNPITVRRPAPPRTTRPRPRGPMAVYPTSA